MAKTIREVFERANEVMRTAVVKELRDQGHHLTGRLEASVVGTVTESGDTVTLTGEALAYAQILSKGVLPARIPFGGSGAGVRRAKAFSGRPAAGSVSRRTSQYIQALIQYFKARGLDDAEAKSAAFATAHKQKREGMPTKGSVKYSSTGTRLNFVGAVSRNVSSKLDRSILGGIDSVVHQAFKKSPSERI